jgi:hypothetical protein
MSASRPLRAVEPDDETVPPEYTPPRDEVIADFEGAPVHFAKAKVTSAAGLEVGDKILKIDDKVVLVLELRCTGVEHKVDQNSGKMTRLQTLRAIDAFVVGTDFETLRTSGL